MKGLRCGRCILLRDYSPFDLEPRFPAAWRQGIHPERQELDRKTFWVLWRGADTLLGPTLLSLSLEIF